MNFEEILEEFDKDDEHFKKDQVIYIKEHKEEFIDDLLKVVENFTNDLGNENYPLSVLYSLYLLSEFKEKRLYPYLIKILEFNVPKDSDFFNYFGDGMYEMMPCFLVSTFNNDFDSLNKIIEDDKYDDDSKELAVKTYSYFLRNNLISRDELIKYLNKIIDMIIEKAQKNSEYNCENFAFGVLEVILRSHLTELLDKAKILYEEDLIDYMMFGDYDTYCSYVREDGHSDYIHHIEDTVKELGCWAVFAKDRNIEPKIKAPATTVKKNKTRKKKPKTNYKNKKKKK